MRYHGCLGHSVHYREHTRQPMTGFDVELAQLLSLLSSCQDRCRFEGFRQKRVQVALVPDAGLFDPERLRDVIGAIPDHLQTERHDVGLRNNLVHPAMCEHGVVDDGV